MDWTSLLCSIWLLLVVDTITVRTHGVNRSTTQLGRIPAEFKLDITRGQSPVNILSFYLNAIKVVTVESVYPFFESTDSFDFTLIDQPPRFFAVASKSVFPHLQHCHIIWAVERVIEIAHESRDYQELKAIIKTRRANKWYNLGLLAVRQQPISISNSTDLSDIEDFGRSLSTGSNLNQSSTQSIRSNHPTSRNGEMLVQAFFVQDGKILKSLDIFLTVIRAIALLAEVDTDAMVSEWHYIDEDTYLRISMSVVPGLSTKTTYGDIVEGLSFLVECMVDHNRFAEMVGKFYEMDPKRIDYGEVVLTRYEPEIAVAR